MKRFSFLTLIVTLFLTTTVSSAPLAMPGTNVVCKTSGTTQICASISNGSPAQYTYVTVYGSLKVNGVYQKSKAMVATWHYKTTTPTCLGNTGTGGTANCTRYIARATKGYKVLVVVKINGYSVTTWFMPH